MHQTGRRLGLCYNLGGQTERQEIQIPSVSDDSFGEEDPAYWAIVRQQDPCQGLHWRLRGWMGGEEERGAASAGLCPLSREFLSTPAPLCILPQPRDPSDR